MSWLDEVEARCERATIKPDDTDIQRTAKYAARAYLISPEELSELLRRLRMAIEIFRDIDRKELKWHHFGIPTRLLYRDARKDWSVRELADELERAPEEE